MIMIMIMMMVTMMVMMMVSLMVMMMRIVVMIMTTTTAATIILYYDVNPGLILKIYLGCFPTGGYRVYYIFSFLTTPILCRAVFVVCLLLLSRS